MGKRINNIMMMAFWKLSGVLPFEEALKLFKNAIHKTYISKGEHVVEANFKALDAALDALTEIDVSKWKKEKKEKNESLFITAKNLDKASTFIKDVTSKIYAMEGDSVAVSQFTPGGFLPMGTTQFEKRGIALQIPVVDMDKCTQCNYCSIMCPHAAIRPILVNDEENEDAPNNFDARSSKGGNGYLLYKIQVSPLDCTGCELCVHACPDNALTLFELNSVIEEEQKKWNFASNLPYRGDLFDRNTVKGSQFQQPLLEFSGACEGCGETPYVKLLTQLFGERMIIANATGCSSIWGASYPANPYTVNQDGYGPAWGNSLFEDNAEYGYGMAAGIEQRRNRLIQVIQESIKDKSTFSFELYDKLNDWLDNKYNPTKCQRLTMDLVPLLEKEKDKNEKISQICELKDLLPKFSNWIIGGDGWAYDIGFGGLDHVFSGGDNVNVLVLDTEMYSNTGGQMSKSTPLGAVVKFGANGKRQQKKDLGQMAMTYGHVYVASVALAANYQQTLRAFVEAEAYNGPSLVIAYSPCIDHGYTKEGFSHQQTDVRAAVDSGYWSLYRYNPSLIPKNENPFILDSKKLKIELKTFLEKENRFSTLTRAAPEVADQLHVELQMRVNKRQDSYKLRAEGMDISKIKNDLSKLTNQEEGLGKINILFGSETGNAEDVSKKIATDARERGFTVCVRGLDEVELEDIADMSFVVVVCSTAGQGAFPSNALDFWASLEDDKLSNDLLKNLKYCVFGLGDSSYLYFNKAANLIDERFAHLGAERIFSVGLGDDQHEERYETVLGDWLSDLFVELKAPLSEEAAAKLPDPQYNVVTQDGEYKYEQVVHSGGVLLSVTENTRLTPPDHDRDIRHIEFDLTNIPFKYNMGDSLAIWPQNNQIECENLIKFLNFCPDMWIRVLKAPDCEADKKKEQVFSSRMTVMQMFVECLDILGRPTKRFYDILLKHCTDPQDVEKIKDKSKIRQLTSETVTIADLFYLCPSARPSLSDIVEMVGLIKPRYYSIASDQKYLGGDKVQLAIVVNDWVTPGGKKRVGLCTSYVSNEDEINGKQEKSVYKMCCAKKLTSFHLPSNVEDPIIMAGLGTGLAPFRSFIQNRALLKKSGKKIGPLILYFGCRHRARDYIYGDELEEFRKEGVLTDLRVAFSRDNKDKKVYIQHLIAEDGKTIANKFLHENAHFYLCGQAQSVPTDIRNAISKSLMTEGSMSETQANEYLDDLILKGRYNIEAWS
eukprot:GHVL01044546.1.p1 GENE.GHVL01044546.1~~GHVL01044546.1.p1  ORF type:complete len:1227 (+),score=228.02 GHVL01044546.1:3888-7568(+)